MSTTEIKVEGILDKKWQTWFDGLEIFYEGNKTVFIGKIQDQFSKYCLLIKMSDLNLKLISLKTIAENI